MPVAHSSLRKLPSGVIELIGTAARRPHLDALPRAGVQQIDQRRNLSISELDKSLDGRERVVVLGSGWAGFTVARRLDSRKFQAVVVSPRSYFVFTPLLASTSVGTLEFRTALEPVRSRRNKAAFLQGWAEKMDLIGSKITIEEAADDPRQGLAPTEQTSKEGGNLARPDKKGKMFDLSYDKLVIAVGCYSQTFNTPGVKEHAYFLKDVGDARKIRKRLLDCFETAALPTTSDEMRKNMLNFAVVGGGPTGIEFSAELHDLVVEDMAKLYPDLMKFFKVTVYDVAPNILSMFDEKLGKYAMDHLKREGIEIATSHHVEELRAGPPKSSTTENSGDERDKSCYTLKTKEDGEIGVGMCVWSTGLMMNPFVQKQADAIHGLPHQGIEVMHLGAEKAENIDWTMKRNPKTGAIITDERLRPIYEPQNQQEDSSAPATRAITQNVYALGDCASIENTMYPATAQVASQKAEWLAKRLNKGDIDSQAFKYRNLGIMAYLGNWNAAFQPGKGGDISGRMAFLIWRGAYLTKSVSWRNKILIPTYWFLNWLFGRDVSRF